MVRQDEKSARASGGGRDLHDRSRSLNFDGQGTLILVCRNGHVLDEVSDHVVFFYWEEKTLGDVWGSLEPISDVCRTWRVQWNDEESGNDVTNEWCHGCGWWKVEGGCH